MQNLQILHKDKFPVDNVLLSAIIMVAEGQQHNIERGYNMKTKIERVVHYGSCREDYYDVFYKTGRLVTYRITDIPKTVLDYVMQANVIRVVNNYVTNGTTASVLKVEGVTG